MAVLTLQGLGGGLPASIDADGGAPADSLSIGADGSVGINDMSPDGQLDIHAANATTVGLIVQAAATPSADLFQIRDSTEAGKVVVDELFRLGVGLNDPLTSLHVKALAAGTAYLRLEGQTNTAGVQFKSTTVLHSNAITLDTAQNLGFTNNNGVHSGSVYFTSQNNFIYRDAGNAEIARLTNAGEFGIGAAPSEQFHVSTTGNANSITVDDATGYVGIGTTPTALTQLHVKGEANADTEVIFESQRVTSGDVRVHLTNVSKTWTLHAAEGTGALSIGGSLVLEDGCASNSVRLIANPAGFGNLGLNELVPDASVHVTRTRGETTGPNYPSILLENTGTGDAAYRLEVAAQEWSLYLDNSDSDKLAIRDVTGAANVVSIEPGAAADSLYIDAAGDVGLGADPAAKLDILGGAGGRAGTVRIADVATDATTKNAFVHSRHYTAAEEDIRLLWHQCTSGNSFIKYGGGSGSYNTPNQQQWFVGAGTTTVTGTNVLRLTTTGLGLDSGGTGNPSDTLHVSTTGSADALRIDDATGDSAFGATPASGIRLLVSDSDIAYLKVDSTGVAKKSQVIISNDAQQWRIGCNTNDHFVIEDAIGGSTEVVKIELAAPADSLYIDSGGEVGINTAAPSDLFHVSTTGSANGLRIDDGSGDVAIGAAPVANIRLNIADSSLGAIMRLDSSSFANGESQVWFKNDAREWRTGVTSSNHYVVEDTTGATTPMTILAGAPSDTFYIDSAGEVGINTGAPADLLHVSATGDANALMVDDSTGTVSIGQGTTGGQLTVWQNSTTGAHSVLQLRQEDKNEEFIKFIGWSGASTASWNLANPADFSTPGSIAGWVKIHVKDSDASPITEGEYWMPFYTAPTA